MIIKGSKEFGRSHHQASVALSILTHFWLMITSKADMLCLTSALLMKQRAECICYALLPFRCFNAKLFLFIASSSEL